MRWELGRDIACLGICDEERGEYQVRRFLEVDSQLNIAFGLHALNCGLPLLISQPKTLRDSQHLFVFSDRPHVMLRLMQAHGFVFALAPFSIRLQKNSKFNQNQSSLFLEPFFSSCVSSRLYLLDFIGPILICLS